MQGFLQDYFSTPESWTTKTSAQKVLGALNRWLYGMSIRHRDTVKPSYVSTLSVLIVKSNTAYLFHVGDTRVYRWRDSQLEQLTRDHRVIAGGGKMFLSHAMGIDPNIEIDFSSFPVEQGDTFVLLTDGVYEFVNNTALMEMLASHNHPQLLSESICRRAYDNNSDDNISCQVIQIEQLPFHDDEDAFYRQITTLPFPPPLSSGVFIDGFRIIRELHASARTQVYLAKDSETNELIVLKTPSINYADDADFIDHFLHEEWVGRRINNTHVLKVLAHPRKRSFLYYLTEYCEGQTLRQWIIDNPRPSLDDVRNIVTQIMRGLMAFHKQEMVHRDLKPENIVIDKNHTVKLIDFGSTRIAGVDEISTPVIRRSTVIGTVNYSAPELLAGSPGTAQSDYFSLGVITYEMLTHRLPYGDEPGLQKLRRSEYKPAAGYNSDIPGWIDGALRKCVDKDPQKRYELLSEFIYDLSNPNREFLQHKSQPLIERDPLRFWQWVAGISILINLFLLYWFSR